MRDPLPRRHFLQAASAFGLGAGLGSRDALAMITPALAEEAKVKPEMVRFRPEIEPVVRWIEETPREQAFEKAVVELKDGLSYRSLLAGLFLAGIRNIKPRPVGFKFHAVMVINSAHLLGQIGAVSERLLPLFWALDNFKASQAAGRQGGRLDARAGSTNRACPSPHRRKAELHAGDGRLGRRRGRRGCRWPLPGLGAAETMEPVWRMAVRDQRNIGHKPIFAAQSWRTLQAIGWEHAEPVLRSLTFGLLDLQGRPRPSRWVPMRPTWKTPARSARTGRSGDPTPGPREALLQTIRQANPEAASAEAVKMLNGGVAPGVALGRRRPPASEMMMRSPGIVAIHATTAANALHYIFGASGDELTRRLALLQAVGWQPLYRDRAKARRIRSSIDALKADASRRDGDEAIGEIFATINDDRSRPPAKAIGYLGRRRLDRACSSTPRGE